MIADGKETLGVIKNPDDKETERIIKENSLANYLLVMNQDDWMTRSASRSALTTKRESVCACNA